MSLTYGARRPWRGGDGSGHFSTATSRARLVRKCTVVDPPTRYNGEDEEEDEATAKSAPAPPLEPPKPKFLARLEEQVTLALDDEDDGPMPTITPEGHARRLEALRQTIAWVDSRWLIRLSQRDVEGGASVWVFAALFAATELRPTPTTEDWDRLFHISLAHGVRPGSEVGSTLTEHPTGLHRWSWREESCGIRRIPSL